MADEIEKKRLNVGVFTIIGICSSAAITAFGWGVTFTTASAAISNLQDRISNVEKQTVIIPNLSTRFDHFVSSDAENKAAIKAVNERVDKFGEVFGNKLDLLLDKVTKVDKATEVLTTRIEYRK